MRYLAIWRPRSGEEGGMPSPEHMAEMGKLVEEQMQAGNLVNTEPLAPRSAGFRITRTGDRYTVSEETERAGGYAILQANSKEDLIEQVKVFLAVAGDGVSEVRQIAEFGPPPAL